MSALNSSQKALLNALVEDENKANKELYSAGPYWNYKAKKILYNLKKKGINNFRGLNSGVGTSYTDNIVTDVRNELGFKGRLLSSITYLPFIRKIYDNQIKIASINAQKFIKKNQKYYQNHEKVSYLISKYKIEKSTEFGCELKFEINKKDYSCHYLDIANRIETISKFLNINKVVTYFEIGGGFGANIHFLLNNFPNIKKIIYLDIAPNLFVGTEYLRSFYGNSVKDYCSIRSKSEIKFSNDDELEIYCIPPWKIENVYSNIDHFHNAASFQEMSEKIVKNYSKFILKLLNTNGTISLLIYDTWKKNNTLGPSIINNVFNNKLSIKEFPRLDDDQRKVIYLLSRN